MYVNLYYGAKVPLVCGARQFTSLTEAENKAYKENYYGTIEFTPRNKTKPFTIEDYQNLVEDAGTHILQTTGGQPARLIADDRLSQKGYLLVALVENDAGTKERVSTYTASGKFQIGENSPEDLVLVPVLDTKF